MSNDSIFDIDMDRNAVMKDALFETFEQFMENKNKVNGGHPSKIDYDQIAAQIKMTEVYAKQIMLGIHAGHLHYKKGLLPRR